MDRNLLDTDEGNVCNGKDQREDSDKSPHQSNRTDQSSEFSKKGVEGGLALLTPQNILGPFVAPRGTVAKRLLRCGISILIMPALGQSGFGVMSAPMSGLPERRHRYGQGAIAVIAVIRRTDVTEHPPEDALLWPDIGRPDHLAPLLGFV